MLMAIRMMDDDGGDGEVFPVDEAVPGGDAFVVQG